MTATATELAGLRELADDLFGSITEPHLHSQQTALPYSAESWRLLGESGLSLLTTPEASGGSGAGITEAAIVLDRSGYHALPAPLAESDLLAAWLLVAAGADVPDGPLTAASTMLSADADLVVLEHVPWAQVASAVVVTGPGFVGVADLAECSVTPVGDLAGEYRGNVTVPASALQTLPTADLRPEFRIRGAWARSAQICGATERALDLATVHVGERHQFGRPIGKFQAVQELIARSAGYLVAAKAAASHAATAVDERGFGGPEAQVAVAVAKIQAGRAAVAVSRDVHQAHGAIGFTLDHQLRHFTTRMLAWNRDFDGPSVWERELASVFLASGVSVWEFATTH